MVPNLDLVDTKLLISQRASFAGPDEEFRTKYIFALCATPEKPFQNTTTPQFVGSVLWSAYKNTNQQATDICPGTTSYKFIKHTTFSSILETLPKRQLKALNQYLHKHPMFPLKCIPSEPNV
jgi:hypothetical protein